MYRYVLFDLDGTLTDPKVGITTCVQYALHSFGIEEETEKLTSFIGPPLKESFMEFYGFDEDKAEQAIEKYRERFSNVGLFENEIYPGIEKMLKKLHNHGMKLAVASSKPTVFVEKILKHFHIDTYFDVVVGSELDGRRTDKQEVVQEALRQIGVTEDNRDTCVMIGDRKFDIIGAKAERVHSVGVTFGYAKEGELEQEAPDYIAKSVEELQQYLLSNVQNSERKISLYSRVQVQEKLLLDNHSTIGLIVEIILPILLYYLIRNFIVLLMASAIQFLSLNGAETEKIASFFAIHSQGTSILIQLMAMVIGTGIVFPMFLIEKPIFFHRETKKTSLFFVIMLGSSAALFFNVLFGLLQFTGSSKAYQEVAATQFSASLISGLFIYGIVSPIAEEIVFRGIVYNRLRKRFPFIIAFVMSALLFGVYHGNMVQAVYGFILGLVITWVYERYGSFLMPLLVHAVANVAVYIVMNSLQLKNAVFTPLACIVMGIVATACFIRLQNE